MTLVAIMTLMFSLFVFELFDTDYIRVLLYALLQLQNIIFSIAIITNAIIEIIEIIATIYFCADRLTIVVYGVGIWV